MKSFIKYSVISALLILFSCVQQGEQFTTSFDGVNISFNRQGSSETAILFIHGWSNNKSIWDAQLAHFSKSYSAIAVDLPGFGESGNNRSDWTVKAYARDIAAIVNNLNLQKVVLVGFSLGGPVVVEAAHLLPDKIEGVVLVDALDNVEMKFPPPLIHHLDSLFMDLVSNPTPEKMLGGGFYKKNPEKSYQRISKILTGVSHTGWHESLREALRWQNEECISALHNIQVPLKAIYSERGSVDIEALQKYVPSFEANIIKDTGHLVMWDETEKFNTILEEYMQIF